MDTYIALLRAVNAGGTGKLSIKDFVAICEDIGFKNTQTHIASGNAVFKSDKTEAQIKVLLGCALLAKTGQDIGVLVRTKAELSKILSEIPFSDLDTSRTVAIFLDKKPPRDMESEATGRTVEKVKAGAREIYVYFAAGIGRSKLHIGSAKNGTARSVNTIGGLVDIAEKLTST